MHESSGAFLDPRIRRTRLALQRALETLLEVKELEKISVGDITDAATVNRATFYDHYPDKYTLLEAMVSSRFHELLAARGIAFDGGCTSALHAMILGICDYLAAMPRFLNCERRRQTEPHLESAVIAVVRNMLIDGLAKQPAPEGAVGRTSSALIATTMSWAMYGAAKEWISTPDRCPSESMVATIAALVEPIMQQRLAPLATAENAKLR